MVCTVTWRKEKNSEATSGQAILTEQTLTDARDAIREPSRNTESLKDRQGEAITASPRLRQRQRENDANSFLSALCFDISRSQ